MSKYCVADFHTKSLNSVGSKMALLMGENDTGEYLLVLGAQCPDIQDQRMVWAKSRNDIGESARIEDVEQIDIIYALVLVDGWSFDDELSPEGLRLLLSENQGLAYSVIAHSFDYENYFEKK